MYDRFVREKTANMSKIDGGGKFAIANIGSNPAMYGFEYPNDIGINLSIGRSGLDVDLEMLKFFRFQLKPGAKILITIMPFYSILGDAKDTMNIYDKYAYYRILGKQRIEILGFTKDIAEFSYRSYKKLLKRWLFPIRAIKDMSQSKIKDLSYQPMSPEELETDAGNWWINWGKEFDIMDYDAPLTAQNAVRREISIKHLYALIDFCKENQYEPFFVLMPMTEHLLRRMSNKFKETYLYSFVKPIAQATNTPILDYMRVERFLNDELYLNSLFLNRQGAKLFTKQVLKDVGLEK